ncbi:MULTISPECIES: hypothetical protein [unclassified Sphingobium]|uniref:hypothetical protein n=1 Tax=unclassified Sphingobium TaxID=2611147 RepID=UPI0005088350|nr:MULTISPECIES: hypothetical protein [unclassified Sphingobium]KFL45884.1 hypothetical protein IL54_1296 [Sphingobium sp. ba1]
MQIFASRINGHKRAIGANAPEIQDAETSVPLSVRPSATIKVIGREDGSDKEARNGFMRPTIAPSR